MDRERFKQLYILAHGGDMEAKADLWLEFEFAFDHDPLPAFMNPSSLQGRACSPSAPSGGAPASVTDKQMAVADPATNNYHPSTINSNSKEACNAHSS